MGVRLDRTQYPVIVLRFPPTGTSEDVHAWYDAVERCLDEAEAPIAFLDDLRLFELGGTRANLRRLAAERHDRLVRRYAHVNAGNARVVDGPITRAILRVFDWLSPAPWPIAHFRTEEEALAWCHARVSEARAGFARGEPS